MLQLFVHKIIWHAHVTVYFRTTECRDYLHEMVNLAINIISGGGGSKVWDILDHGAYFYSIGPKLRVLSNPTSLEVTVL
jgi:hypothetical protein